MAVVAKLNKLLLAHLRSVGDVLRDELVREKARYGWFMRNVANIVRMGGLVFMPMQDSCGGKFQRLHSRRP